MTADLPWGLEEPPETARLPRIVTGRGARSVGTYGPEMLSWCEERPLNTRRSAGWRWWQKYVAYRALEHDADGHLVWDTVVLSACRQVGKSWLERGLCAWRMAQAERFGETQTVLHVAHKLVAAQEVWLPAARWAKTEQWATRYTNGEQRIEASDGSRWLLQAASAGAGVAFSLTMGLIDEAWQVGKSVADGAIGPTLVNAESPQLWLVSTAGDGGSDLMATSRAAGIAMADAPDPGSLLLIEWSAPPDPELDIDDPKVWRDASPYWDARREERVATARSRIDEYAFRQQYLNQWVPTTSPTMIEPRLWASVSTTDGPSGPMVFAFDVAPDRSGAAVVACGGGVLEIVRVDEGVAWVADEILRLVERWGPLMVVADPGGPAMTITEQLAGELDDRLVLVKSRDVVAACAGLFDGIAEGVLRHRSHVALDGAVAEAGRRSVSGSWVFDRARPGGHVLIAAALAWWGERHPVGVPEESWYIT